MPKYFPPMHMLQVCGVRDKKPDNIWLAAEGVYLPVAEGKSSSS